MIDINSPDFFSATQAAVNQYASPEAAQRDFQDHAPQALDEYNRRYQALTGDAFADPFADQIKARDSALMNSIVNSRVAPGIGPVDSVSGTNSPISLNVGGQNGPTINPATQVIAQRNLVDAAKARRDATAPDTMLNATLSHPQYQLPESTNPEFGATQLRRAHAFGVTDIFDQLTKTNPEALKLTDSTDPELQKDAKGKPIAGDVLNGKLYNDPNFQRLLSTDPPKAYKLYEAAFGRNLEQDLAMQRAANSKRTDTRDKIFGDLSKNLIFDDITGQAQLRTYQRDPISGDQIEGKPRALSAIEQNAIDQEGGFEAKFGFKPPQGLGLHPDETNALRSEQSRIMSANPSIPKPVALLQARKNLADRNAAPVSPTAPSGGLAGVGATLQNVGRNIGNTGIDQANRLLQGIGTDAQLPEIPSVTDVNHSIGSATGDIFDWLKGFGRDHVYSRSGNLAIR